LLESNNNNNNNNNNNIMYKSNYINITLSNITKLILYLLTDMITRGPLI